MIGFHGDAGDLVEAAILSQWSIKAELHSQESDSLLFSLLAAVYEPETLRNSQQEKWLGPEFPGIPAPFPDRGQKFADSGQNRQNSPFAVK